MDKCTLSTAASHRLKTISGIISIWFCLFREHLVAFCQLSSNFQNSQAKRGEEIFQGPSIKSFCAFCWLGSCAFFGLFLFKVWKSLFQVRMDEISGNIHDSCKFVVKSLNSLQPHTWILTFSSCGLPFFWNEPNSNDSQNRELAPFLITLLLLFRLEDCYRAFSANLPSECER